MLLLPILAACDLWQERASDNWGEFTGAGLSRSHSHYDYFHFFDNSNGVLAGYTARNIDIKKDKRLNQNDALICITHDGGKTWEEHIVGKGFVNKVAYINNTYLYLKNVYNNEMIGNHVSGIYETNNFKDNHKLIYSPPNGIFIQNIQFITEKKWLATLSLTDNDEWKTSLSLTSDAGQTWEVLIDNKHKTSEYAHIFYEGSIYGILSKRPEISKLDLATRERSTIHIKAGTEIQNLKITTKDELWSMSRSGKKAYLSKIVGNNIIEVPVPKEREFPFIIDFDIIDQNIFVVQMTHTSIVGGSKTFFYSPSFGLSWNEEKLPNDLFASKFAFKENGEVLAYSLSGDFQIRAQEKLLTKK